MNIEQLFNEEVMGEEDQYVQDVYRSYWRTSNFGRCFRLQFWYRQGVPMSDPVDPRTLKIFRIGHMFHRDIQSLLPQDKVEVEFKTEDVFGHADYVGDDEVVDFKTVGVFPWKYLCKPDFNIVKDKKSNILQVMAYCKFFDKPVGKLIFINKDNYEMKTYEFNYSDWEGKVNHELTVLRDAWRKSELPEAIPRAYNCKDCNYCPFQGRCNELEGNTPKDRLELTKKKKEKSF